MRIFQVCGDPGIVPDGTKGAAAHLRSIAGALRGLGHEVLTLSRREPSAAGPFPVFRLEGRESILDVAAERGAPDLVYERYALGQADGLEAARELGCPFALEINAPLVDEAAAHRPAQLRPEHREIERRLWREADLAAAVSRPLLARVESVRGRPGAILLRNGCDPSLFPHAAPSFQTGEPVLVFLGHPKPWHGARRLPAMLRQLDEEGFSARLLVIGGGEGADQVLAAAREAGVAGRVEVTGPLPQQQAIERLAEGTVAVAPYPPLDGFYFCPLKVIECMAAGLPVVATRQGDLWEIAGEDAVLVDAGDDEAFAGAVAGLLSAPRRRHALGQRARRRALAHFTWEAAARALVDAVAGLPPRRAKGARP